MSNFRKHRGLISWSRAFLRVIYLYIFVAIIILVVFKYYSKDLPSIEQLQNFDPELTSRIYSTDGIVLQELHTQRRILVPLEDIPPAIVHALISIEDSRFLNHWGISVRDNIRAIIVDIATLSKKQGASTLTQQLARILYESIGFEKTFSRKIKELLTALQIERIYSKREIIEMYINSSYMGHGAYGIQAAAKRYFNKSSESLTPDECALIAGVIKNPARYSPLLNPINAFQRRNLVLYKMMEHDFLPVEEYALYRNAPIQIEEPEPSPVIAPYFVEYVRQWLTKEEERLGVDIYRDGLSIYTTLNTRIQSRADSAMLNHLKHQQKVLNKRLLSNPSELEAILNDPTLNMEKVGTMIRGDVPLSESLKSSLVVQGALVAIEPSSGKILAMVGGRDFDESQFNRATQAKRQPGSAFKPIVYVTAIDNGFPVTTQLLNQPVVINMPDGTRWTPQNYEKTTGGNTTLREALKKSINLVSVRIVQELISPASVVETARRMHLTTKIPAFDAIALGAAEVIPLELTSAYGIFANNGIWVEPIAVTRIEDKYGNTIAEYFPKQELIFSEETSYLITNLLETAINEGTGRNSRLLYGFHYTAAGKTGTTNNFNDAWFVGFTPYLVAGVWVGVDNQSVSLGTDETGARAALPVWAKFMREAYKLMNWKDKEFVRPAGVIEVEICKETKLLPSKFCPRETELFTKQTVPREHCPLHTDFEEPVIEDKIIF